MTRRVPQNAMSKVLRDLVDDEINALDDQLSSGLREADLSQQVGALEGTIAAIRSRLASFLVRTKRKQNSLLPIHRLPEELFVEILLLATQSPFKMDVKNVMKWASVCSQWHHVVSTSPVFWRQIKLGCNPNLLDLILQRNPSGPLDLYWEPYKVSAVVSSRLDYTSYGTMAQRCRSLYIDTWYEDAPEHIMKQYGRYASEIELYSDVQDEREGDEPFVHLSDGSPLFSLASRRAGLTRESWNTDRLSALKTLFLSETGNLPTDSQLYAVLAAATQLSILGLESLNDPEYMASTLADLSPSVSPIDMPSLRLVYMSSIPSRILKLFFAYVRCPACQYIDLQFGSSCLTEPSSFFSNLDPANWMQPSHEVVLEIYKDYLGLRDGDSYVPIWQDISLRFIDKTPSALSLHVDVEERSHWTKIMSMLDIWSAHVTSLVVEASPGVPSPEALIRGFPNRWKWVVYLHIEGNNEALVPFLRFLSHSNPTIPLPNLYHLSLGFANIAEHITESADEVVSMVERRYAGFAEPTRVVRGAKIPLLFLTTNVDSLTEELKSRLLPAAVTLDGDWNIGREDLIRL